MSSFSRDFTEVDEATRAIVASEEVNQAERKLGHRIRVMFGINQTDVAALRHIDQGTRRGSPVRAADLARRFDVSSASATEMAHRLERSQLVLRLRDPADGRNRVLVLTPDADARLDACIGDVRTGLSYLLLELSVEEQARLLKLLNAIRDVYRDSSPTSEE